MKAVRVATHVHSEWSYDATWSLTRLSRLFARLRFDAVLMTEHDRGFDQDRWEAYSAACARASTQGTLLVPGVEYSDQANAVHVPVWGTLPFLGEGLETTQLLRLVPEHDGVAILAHPARAEAWRLLPAPLDAGLCGVEIWNRKSDGYAPSSAGLNLWKANPRLIPFVGMDFHEPRQLFPLSMEMQLEGPLSRDGILTALRTGRCAPRAWGGPAERFANERTLLATRITERARRRVARALMKVRSH